MSYALVSGETRHREHPDTFAMPPAEERYNARPGALVKLIFVTEELGLTGPGERMWVEVTDVKQHGYTGILRNTPVVIEDLDLEDTIEFLPEHIVSFWDNE